MKLDFVNAAKTGVWKVAGASLTGECDGVAFTGDRKWWGGRWTVTGTSEFPVPEKLILFVSEEGMEHGFWRDMTVGESGFDYRHFVFCDTPGLLQLVVGAATQRAIGTRARDQAPISLYVRGGVMRTKGMNDERDEGAIERHVAIHRALAADHAALIARWQDCLASASGRGGSTWPLTGQITSRIGTLLVGLTWERPPESRDGAEWDGSYGSLHTEVTVVGDREKPRWVFAEVLANARATHTIGERRYALTGTASVPIDRIAKLVEDGDLVSIAFGPKLTISLRGLANERRLLAAVQIAEQLLHAQAGSTSPYR